MMKQSPITPLHEKLGARMGKVEGWTMPQGYTDLVDEHLAVRSSCGVFDTSHLSKFRVQGVGALAWLESTFSCSVASMEDGAARPALLLNRLGVIVDHVLLARRTAEQFFIVGSASQEQVVEARLHAHLPLLNEGHYHHFMLRHEINAHGIGCGSLLLDGLLLGCGLFLFALLHLLGLGLKEGGARYAGMAVAAIVDGEDMKSAGGCQLVIAHQQGLGNRRSLGLGRGHGLGRSNLGCGILSASANEICGGKSDGATNSTPASGSASNGASDANYEEVGSEDDLPF
mgnify:CR=1 FL=1